MTLLEVIRSWSDRVPVNVGAAIAGWLLDHDVLVARARAARLQSTLEGFK